MGGHSLAEGSNGALSFLAITWLGSDGLGSALVALDGSSGNATASVLYDPYGRVRYTNGAMPGSRGFTNQHADSTTGLDYYQARYYDAVAGQFISADTQSDGLNGYAYVHANPETFTDPSGHRVTCGIDCGGSSGGSGGPAPTNGGCTSDSNCDPNGTTDTTGISTTSTTGGCGSCATAGNASAPAISRSSAALLSGLTTDPPYVLLELHPWFGGTLWYFNHALIDAIVSLGPVAVAVAAAVATVVVIAVNKDPAGVAAALAAAAAVGATAVDTTALPLAVVGTAVALAAFDVAGLDYYDRRCGDNGALLYQNDELVLPVLEPVPLCNPIEGR